MRMGLLSELSAIGYEIFLEGETIRLRYQRPGTPPESARQLIDELRKYKAEAVNILKTNTITPLEIVEPGANVKAIWRNPYPQGAKEARIESLTQIMGAIFQESFKKVREIYEKSGTQFKGTPEILNTEQRIEALQRAVLNGEAKLNDFQLAAYEWERASKAEFELGRKTCKRKP